MDYRRLFTGIPDGLGIQEDPGYLCHLYKEFEHTCFDRTQPQLVQPARLWFPINNYLDRLNENLRGSRWERSQRLFEAYRFAEASLAAVQCVSDSRNAEIAELFHELPPHLRAVLFGLPVEREEIEGKDGLREFFRRSFRVSWFFVNNDESVMVRYDIEEEDFERITASDAPYELKLAAESVNLEDEARRTGYQVRHAFRDYRGNDTRLNVMQQAQMVLELRRIQLTALLKAITDFHQEKKMR